MNTPGSLTVMGLMLLFWAVGCDQAAPPASGASGAAAAKAAPTAADAAQQAREEDAEAEKDLKEKKAEAREWLAVPGNKVWKGDRKEITALVEQMHQLGAKHVWVTGMSDVKEFGGNEMAAMFVIELPAERTARASLINTYNHFVTGGEELDQEERDEITVKEQGQKYIVLNLDM
jgi:hypothetical protein